MLQWLKALSWGRYGWLLRRHVHLVLTLGVLLFWSLTGLAVAEILFLPVWVMATQLIVAGSLEAARLRRRAWLGQYLYERSPWHRWLRGGVVMVVRHQLLGVGLALVLLVELRLLPLVCWPVLLLGAVAMVVSRDLLRRRLSRHVIARHVDAVTRRLLMLPTAGLLMIALVMTVLWLPQPYLVGLRWEEALLEHLQGRENDSLLGFFVRVGSTAEITQVWVMQNAMQSLRVANSAALLGWVLLLLTQSAFAWAYVRLLVGADVLCREGRHNGGNVDRSGIRGSSS
ncbi:hypothetical protein KG088_09980 [Halomonas sp. TRM85114]|uniref:hypothetical protein n=1 Tax=Halomonas jincaotanensis TaxID=2810616 RepID=UPI001BD6B1E5|nr:hypothetical protein [Halomonas jincaotanensis]MBS9403958.1 hypothetical protein [Halomonas jincaotanensis]